MTHHQLDASLATCHWGYFDAGLTPVLEIESGDSVTIRTVTGGPAHLPDGNATIPPEIHEIHDKAERMLPGHILTGPIAVKGACHGASSKTPCGVPSWEATFSRASQSS